MFGLQFRRPYQTFEFYLMYDILLFGEWGFQLHKLNGSVLSVTVSYVVVVLNGAKNPYRSAVAHDIKNAIMKTRAEKGTPATYWSQAEQVKHLEEAYQKWSRHGGVWSAAAVKVSLQTVNLNYSSDLHMVTTM